MNNIKVGNTVRVLKGKRALKAFRLVHLDSDVHESLFNRPLVVDGVASAREGGYPLRTIRLAGEPYDYPTITFRVEKGLFPGKKVRLVGGKTTHLLCSAILHLDNKEIAISLESSSIRVAAPLDTHSYNGGTVPAVYCEVTPGNCWYLPVSQLRAV